MEKRKERIDNLEETPHLQRTVTNLQRIMTKPSIFRYEGHNYLVPFLIISSLFFMWGFAHGILEVLNPHFQESFHISKAMSALTQAAVYGAYFLMALPAGWIIRKWGYRRGVITGLVLFGIGALMFIPGSRINSCSRVSTSLFLMLWWVSSCFLWRWSCQGSSCQTQGERMRRIRTRRWRRSRCE